MDVAVSLGPHVTVSHHRSGIYRRRRHLAACRPCALLLTLVTCPALFAVPINRRGVIFVDSPD